MSCIAPWLYFGLNREAQHLLAYEYASSISIPFEERYHEQAPTAAGAGYRQNTAHRIQNAAALGSRSSGPTAIRQECNKFQMKLILQQFAPNEVTVRTVDRYVTVEAQHEEKRDGYGLISRHFSRRYLMPEGCSPNLLEYKLSSDGVLTIVAQRAPPVAKDERAFPMYYTGPIPMGARYLPSVSNFDN